MSERAEQLYKQSRSAMRKEMWPDAIKLLRHELDAIREDWRISWNLGWCHFKLGKFDEARKHMIRAAKLAPENPACKGGLGAVYLERRQFKKAEAALIDSLNARESYVTRALLALAYLSQGKVAEAESVHLKAIKLKPKQSLRYEGYSAFLSDVGRKAEARAMHMKAEELRLIH